MEESESFTWRSLLAGFLWLIVALGGLSLIMPILTILFALGAAMGSGDPTSTVMDRYRVVSARYVGVFFYGAAWLAGIIFLNTYYQKAKTLRTLFVRFAWAVGIEAAVWGIGYLVQELTMG